MFFTEDILAVRCCRLVSPEIDFLNHKVRQKYPLNKPLFSTSLGS